MIEVLTALAFTLCLYEMITRKICADLPVYLAKSIQPFIEKRAKDTHYLIYSWVFLILALVFLIKSFIKTYLLLFKVQPVNSSEIFNLYVSPIMIFSATTFLCLAIGKACMILAKENPEKEASKAE